MSFAETVLLGALAGFTIYLGLPLARLRALSPRARVALAMFAVGVLAFLFVDVMSHGEQILEGCAQQLRRRHLTTVGAGRKPQLRPGNGRITRRRQSAFMHQEEEQE